MDQPLQGLAIQDVRGDDWRCAMGNMHTITFATIEMHLPFGSS